MTSPFFLAPHATGDLDDQINEMHRARLAARDEAIAAEQARVDAIWCKYTDLEVRDRCVWNLRFNKTKLKDIAETFGITTERVRKILLRKQREAEQWHKQEPVRDHMNLLALQNCTRGVLETRIAFLQALADFEWPRKERSDD